MIFVVAVVLGALFGAGDQYLGSLSALWWAAPASLLSAPWLLVAFTSGWTQQLPRRAIAAGLVATVAALAGYLAMTLSPVENAHFTLGALGALLHSEDKVIVGGLITGPLYGWLGNRWRVTHGWASAALAAGPLCLEPLARAMTGSPSPRMVWLAEVAAGLALAAFFLAIGLAHRRAAGTQPAGSVTPL
jgi:hypothetical protein